MDGRISLRSRSQSYFRRRASNRGRPDAAQHQRVAVCRSRWAYPRVRRHRSAIRERVRSGSYFRARAYRKLSLARNLADGRPAKGLLKTNRGILMVRPRRARRVWAWAEPRHGDIRQLLSAAEIEKIGAHAQANVSMVTLRDSVVRAVAQADEVTQAYETLNDLYGRPIYDIAS